MYFRLLPQLGFLKAITVIPQYYTYFTHFDNRPPDGLYSKGMRLKKLQLHGFKTFADKTDRQGERQVDMTITIELSPEEEARLQARARRQGQDATAAAREIVRAGLPPVQEADDAQTQAVLIQRLRDAGLLTTLPTHPGQTVPFQPITALGPPVSQTLLEDREPH